MIGQGDGNWLQVLEEVVLPDSNTQAACMEFHKRAATWERREWAAYGSFSHGLADCEGDFGGYGYIVNW